LFINICCFIGDFRSLVNFFQYNCFTYVVIYYFQQQSNFCVYQNVSEWCRCVEFVMRQKGGHIEHIFSWRAKY